MKKWIKNYWALFIPVLVILATLLYLLFNKKTEQNQEQILGMVDAEYVDVSSGMPGRLEKIMVSEGQRVTSGETLAMLKTDEIETIKSQAIDATIIAQNNLDLLNRGVAPEIIQSAFNLQKIAEEQMDLMNKTNKRFQDLYKEGVVSGQEKDLVYFRYKAAQKELETAKLNVELLRKGSNDQMTSTAKSLVNQAKNAEKLLTDIKDNASLKAPENGIISTIISKSGEMVNAGYPVMTIQKNNSFFISFNIRQDKMAEIKQGQTVEIKIPGVTPEIIKAQVKDMAAALGYSDWVPENQSGQFQLKTFKIKCVPLNMHQIQGLRSGMTAQLILSKP